MEFSVKITNNKEEMSITLPIPEDKAEEFSDYKLVSDFHFENIYISKEDDIVNINDAVISLNNMDSEEVEKLELYLECISGNIVRAINEYDSNSYEYYIGYSIQDLTEQLLNEGYFGEISSYLIGYIDIESLSADLDDYVSGLNGVIKIM